MKYLKQLCCVALLSIASIASASERGITLINPFEVPADKLEETIAYWELARDFLQQQPGYISTSLHQSIADDARFRLINLAHWESAEAFMKAAKKMQAEAGLPRIDGLIPNPGLYTVIREDEE